MKKLILFLVIACSCQLKSQCFQIESILVDACSNPEGQNEMFTFKVGNTPLNTSELSISWPNASNPWLGVCQNAGTASDIATVNATITKCGYLKEPVGGVLPANSQVLMITSTAWNPLAHSFANLSDTLIVIFQCAGNTNGHFANYGIGIRTLTVTFNAPAPAGCTETVSYDRSMLLTQAQVPGAQDGGAVDYDAAGNPTYVNRGCTVPVKPLSVSAGPSYSICSNATQALTATASGSPNSVLWSLGSGATGSFTPTNSLTTTYTPGAGDNNTIKLYCTVMRSCAGNTVTAKDSMNITVKQLPLPSITTTSSSICSGQSTILSYSLSNAGATGTTSVQWLPSNATTPTISVNTAGAYSVQVSNSCGSNTAAFSVSVSPTPSVNISSSGPTQFCAGGSVTLTATSNTGNYSWTGGATTSSVSVNSTSTVVVTSTNSCGSSSATQTVLVNPIPPASATSPQTITCVSPTVTLSGSGGGTYSWSGPGIVSGGSTATPVVNQPGSYTVLVTASGCTNTAVTNVSQNINPPAVTATSNATLNCNASTVSIAASTTATPVSYSWTGPGIVSGGTTANPVVNQPGSYNVLVTYGSCTNTAVTNVSQNSNPPAVVASSSASLNCINTSATVVASTTATPVSYNWSGPGIVSGATTASATVNAGGTYNYTVTNTANGCITTGNIPVTQNTVQPNANASTGSMITCTSNTVSLNASPGTGVTYTWTAAGGSSMLSGVNTSTATAQGAGPYTVTIKDNSNGCVKSATVAPGTNTTAITPTISAAPVITCGTSTVSLGGSPGSGVLYSWNGPGVIAPSNLSTVNLNQPGNYVLTVTNTANGCTGSASVAITQNTTAPTVSVSPTQTITCASPSVSISGAATPNTSTASWSGVCGPTNLFTTTACATGTFVLTVTDPANGCTNTASVTVVSSNGLPQVTASSSGSITCSTSTTQVSVTTTASPVSYSWSGPGITAGATTASATVNAGGTYTCVVTNTVSGCASTITSFVPTNTTAVSVSTSPSGSITCIATTQTLSASPTGSSYTFSWSGPGITAGAATANPVVNAGGSYVVTITNTVSGCTGTNTVVVPQDNAIPTLTISPNTFTVSCTTPTVQLNANPSVPTVTYNWTSNPNGALTSNSITNPVASVGTFSAVVTNTVNGCVSAPATATVYANASVPTVSLSAGSVSITCSNSSPTVAVTSTISTLSYSWSPTPSNGSNTPTPVFSQPGTYNCVVTNTVNGCSTSANVTVSSNTVAPALSTTGTQTLTCANPTAVLSVTATPSSNMTYTWTGPGMTGPANTSSVNVNQPGTYSLTVQDAVTGCSTTATSSVVSLAGVPNASVTASGTATAISCASPSMTLTATSSPSANISYAWSTGSTGNSSIVSTAGVITVTVVNTVSNCSTTVQYTVTGNTTAPGVTAASGQFPCGAASTTLSAGSADPNVSYAWTGPSASSILSGGNTSSPSISAPGVYTVTATDAVSGCTSTGTVNVTKASVTAAFTADPSTGVAPLTVHFSNGSTGATSYQWSFGDNNTSSVQDPSDVYNSNGSYTVMLIASSGTCSDTAYTVIVVNEGLTIEIPNVFTPNGDNVNDVFYIKSTGVKEISLDIFNRWGQKLYEFTGPKAAWDGRTGTGEHVPDGTYFFFVKATGFNDKTIEQHGTLSLFH